MDNQDFEILIKKKKEYLNTLESINFLIRTNQLSKSIKLIRKLRNSRFCDKNFFYTYALFSFKRSNYSKTISILEKLDKQYGFFEKSNNLLVESLIFNEKHHIAKKIARKTISINKLSFISHYFLGVIHTELGDFKKAEKNFLNSLKIKKDYAPSHYQISRIRKYKKKCKYIKTLEILSEKSEISDKPFYDFSLAKYFDGMKDYRSSFFYLKKGNIQKKFNSKKFKINDFILNCKLKRRLVFLNRQKILCKNSNIFIVGMPRTGSTLIENIFSTNPQVKNGGETSLIDRCILKQKGSTYGELKSNILNTNYNGLFINPKKKKILTDKTLFNFLNIPVIINSFPKSKIIEIIREKEEVIWSIYKNNFQSSIMNFSYSLKDIEKFYKYYKVVMNYFKKKYPGKILSVSYEKFIKNPIQESQKIYNYCGLKWDNSFINFQSKKIIIKTSSSTQLREDIYKTPQENFKQYKKLI